MDRNTMLNAALLSLLGAGAGGLGGRVLGNAFTGSEEDPEVRRERLRRWALAGALLGGGGTLAYQGFKNRKPAPGTATTPPADPAVSQKIDAAVKAVEEATPKPVAAQDAIKSPQSAYGYAAQHPVQSAIAGGAAGTALRNAKNLAMIAGERSLPDRTIRAMTPEQRGNQFLDFITNNKRNVSDYVSDPKLTTLRGHLVSTPAKAQKGQPAPPPTAAPLLPARQIGEELIAAHQLERTANPRQIFGLSARDIAGLERQSALRNSIFAHGKDTSLVNVGTPQARRSFIPKGPGRLGYGGSLLGILPAAIESGRNIWSGLQTTPPEAVSAQLEAARQLTQGR